MQSGSTLEQLPLGVDGHRSAIDNARNSLGTIILGKDEEISLSLACLLGLDRHQGRASQTHEKTEWTQN